MVNVDLMMNNVGEFYIPSYKCKHFCVVLMYILFYVYRYSHGTIIQLSNLKEAIEPDFSNLRIGSRVLLKLKPPDDQVYLQYQVLFNMFHYNINNFYFRI